LTWIGDHGPYHVHVLKGSRTVCKFNLVRMAVIEGKVSRRIRSLIEDLVEEGKL